MLAHWLLLHSASPPTVPPLSLSQEHALLLPPSNPRVAHRDITIWQNRIFYSTGRSTATAKSRSFL